MSPRPRWRTLNKELGDNAWNEYGDNLYRLANDVAPSLSKGLNGIAVEEGKVLNGLIDVVRQSNEADQLPRIFENTRLAVSELNPGLQSLARAFLGLGDQSSQYLPRMASYISDVAEKWANWWIPPNVPVKSLRRWKRPSNRAAI